MLTKEEVADRVNFIGGSDASIICGLNRYKNKVQLWLEKTGQVEPEDISSQPQIIFGNYMEDGVAQWFEDNTGKRLHPKSKEKLIHPKYSWMVANLDRRLIDENAALECKTAGRPGEEWGDGENIIPDMYMTQCAHYCEVGGFDRIYICVVFSLTREFRWYVYEKNQALQDNLVAIENDFWLNNILANIAPIPATKDEVLSLYKESDSEPLIAEDETVDILWKLKKIKESIKSLEKTEEEYVDKIAAAMGKYEILIDSAGQYLAIWKFTKPVNRFDANALKNDDPILHAKYVKIGNPSRRFEIKV